MAKKRKVKRSICPGCCNSVAHLCMGATIEFCEPGYIEVCSCTMDRCKVQQRVDRKSLEVMALQ